MDWISPGGVKYRAPYGANNGNNNNYTNNKGNNNNDTNNNGNNSNDSQPDIPPRDPHRILDSGPGRRMSCLESPLKANYKQRVAINIVEELLLLFR